ncbi:MAG: hypothetical protein ACO1SX_00730 [Actinomycetota bacterium]
MRTRTSVGLHAALALACFSFNSAVAQGPGSPNPATVTPESLPQVLTNLGYEPKSLGDQSWYVIVERPGYVLPVRLSLSSDGSKLWFGSKLGTVDTERLPPQIYQGLLSRETGAARFYICDCANCEKRPEKELFLSQPTPNRYLTPAHFRQELESFCSNAIRLDGRWRPAVTPAGAAAPSAAR